MLDSVSPFWTVWTVSPEGAAGVEGAAGAEPPAVAFLLYLGTPYPRMYLPFTLSCLRFTALE